MHNYLNERSEWFLSETDKTQRRHIRHISRDVLFVAAKKRFYA